MIDVISQLLGLIGDKSTQTGPDAPAPQYYHTSNLTSARGELEKIIIGQQNQGLKHRNGFACIVLTTGAEPGSVHLHVLREHTNNPDSLIDAGGVLEAPFDQVGLEAPLERWARNNQATTAYALAVDRAAPIVPPAAADTQTATDKTRLQLLTSKLADRPVPRIVGLNIRTYHPGATSPARDPDDKINPPGGIHNLNCKLYHKLSHSPWDRYIDETNTVYLISATELIDDRGGSAPPSVLPILGEIEPVSPDVTPVHTDVKTAARRVRNGVVSPPPSLSAAIDPRDPRTGRATIAVADDTIKEFVSLGQR